MQNTQISALQEMAFNVGKIRSTCLLMTWAIAELTTNPASSETESRRFELFEGMSFILETMAKQLHDVYLELNEEKPVR